MFSILPFLAFGLLVAAPILTGNDSDDGVGDPDAAPGLDLQGTDGADLLEGSDGSDTLDGGAGDDILDYGAGDDLNIGEGFGTDETGNDTLFGGDGNDMLFDGLGTNLIDGGDGADLLDTVDFEGDRGTADTLVGGTGDDILQGDDGDSMTGGDGADEFYVFWETDSAPVVITDFNGGTGDVVELEYVADEDLPVTVTAAGDASALEIRLGDTVVARVEGIGDLTTANITATRL